MWDGDWAQWAGLDVLAHIVMAYIVMAYIVTAEIVMPVGGDPGSVAITM